MREQMNIVIVGHVDHGKSTLVGRLLADTHAIDPAKIIKIRNLCDQQGKAFELSFLLDALEAEQAQGITIDSARCFFPGETRDYLIIDAPGHIEFLKNMITGAARAEAAILLIDAAEGVRENSRRHGYLLSLLGIRQIVVVVSKMDRVGFSAETFTQICDEYRAFLAQLDVFPAAFIPVSAMDGDNVVTRSERALWYEGPTVLEAMDGFRKAPQPEDLPLRLPVQDVYRFNRLGDDRRIIAGRVTQGSLRPGDEVVFSPSGKRTRILRIEAFSALEPESVGAGRSTGLTMTEEIYVQRGDVMAHVDSAPRVSNRLEANVFWLGRQPLRLGKTYKLKLATYSGLCEVEEIRKVVDASELSSSTGRERVERHEVAEVVLRLRRPLACDLSHEATDTSRFVLVDGYDLAGGGIVRGVLETQDDDPLAKWTTEAGDIDRPLREQKRGHRAVLLIIHDDLERTGQALAAALEESLWGHHHEVFRLAFASDDLHKLGGGRLELRSTSYAVVATLLNAGQIVIATVPWADDFTHHESLGLPGLEMVPKLQVRFGPDDRLSDGRLSDDHLSLDPAAEPRAQHDAVKRRLSEHLRSA
ncbi:MAG: adenylyl-sulfate kinase [Myxococcales bacterium]|nr:adenylyl-sulfate kinase [Myxococcales bacterium]